MMDAGQSVDRLVVGIDYGTTYSGVAYAYSGQQPERPDDIFIIKRWPGANARVSDKVPSELAYGPSSAPVSRVSSIRSDDIVLRSRPSGSRVSGNAIFDFTKLSAAVHDVAAANGETRVDKCRWGFQLQPDETKLKCMKLFLDSGRQIPSYVSKQDMRDQLHRSGKEPASAVADYLTELFKHTKQTLVRHFGEYFVRNTPLEVMVTVPAIWSDRAKHATFKAAEHAGMGPYIRMISEPEAAAVYTLQAMPKNHLKVGDNFIVCDAGGGTVDLISYEIIRLNPLRIEETVKGTGSCCGAAFLNVGFEHYVRSKLGNDAFQAIREQQPRSWLTALNHFEEFVKRNFDPTDRTDFNIPFPGLDNNVAAQAAGIYQGFLTMSSDAVGALFKPIMGEIISLVEGHLHRLEDRGKTVKAIVLVGGFGQSSCLLKCLQQRFINLPPRHSHDTLDTQRRNSRALIEIMQPANAWTAVARGALLRGLEGTDIVMSRISSRHYGVRISDIYDENVHSKEDISWDELEEDWKVNNLMSWFIKKEQRCSSTEPILFPFYSCMTSKMGYSHVLDLMVCDDDSPPAKSTAGSTYRDCALVVNLENVPARFWEQRTNSAGVSFQHLEYVLGMQIESGRLRFDLRVDDVVYGDVLTDFDSVEAP